MVKIDDIFDVARGGSPRPIVDYITDDPKGINWIMIGDTQEGEKYIDKTAKKIRIEGVKKSREVKEGDFLLTNSMSFGRPYILRTSGCIHDGWLVLSPKSDDIHTDYFYHYLGSQDVKNKLSSKAAGAVVKNLNKDIVKGLEIPLPPLPEQKRIAAILDKADAIRRKRQQAIQLADDFLRSVFLDMFGDPVTNPKGWDTILLKKAGKVSTGSTPPSSKKGMFGGNIPFITPGDLENDGVGPKRFVTAEGSSNSRTVQRGSTFVCCIGATIGKVGIAISHSAFNQQINAIEWNDIIEDQYGYWAMRFLRKIVINKAITTTLPILKKSEFETIEIPTPSINLQKQFTGIVKKTFHSLTNIKLANEEGDYLFNSLSQRAFRGEL